MRRAGEREGDRDGGGDGEGERRRRRSGRTRMMMRVRTRKRRKEERRGKGDLGVLGDDGALGVRDGLAQGELLSAKRKVSDRGGRDEEGQGGR